MTNKMNIKYLSAIVFFVSLIFYFRTIDYGFVWDDERIHLHANKNLIEGHILPFWIQPFSGMYIPVTYSIWTIIKLVFYSGSEIAPTAFHILNNITHSLNSLILFFLLLLLFKKPKQAFLATLLFIIHPLQIESVAWISEFRGLLSNFFGLSAIYLFIKLIDKTNQESTPLFKKPLFYISTFLFIISLLSKPSAIIFPFIVLVIIWCFYNSNFRKSIPALCVWVLIASPILFITTHLQSHTEIFPSYSLYQKSILAGFSLVFYITKVIIPYPIAVCYGYTPEIILNTHYSFLYLAGFVPIFIFLNYLRKKSIKAFSGITIFIITLVPIIGYFHFTYQAYSTVADRYAYTGMASIAMIVATALNHFEKNKIIVGLYYLIIIIFSSISFIQTETWKSEFTVWDHTLKHYKISAPAYYNRGVQYSIQHKFNEAITDYTEALRLNKTYKDAIFNRANAYENIMDYQRAMDDYDYYLLIDSTDGSVYYKRAALFYKTGNRLEAIHNIAKAEQYHYKVSTKFKAKLGIN